MWRTDPSLQPQIKSTTALMSVEGTINLENARETRKKNNRRFVSWCMSLDSGGSASIYKSGKIVLVGCKNPDATVGREVAEKLGCKLLDEPRVSNHVFSGFLGREINPEETKSNFTRLGYLASIELELFPALFVCRPRQNATIQFFRSGKYIITGIKT